MKKNFVCIFGIISIILLVQYYRNHNGVPTTTSYLKVMDKGMESNNGWVVVINPYDSRATAFQLDIHNENLWNIIDKGQVYLITYEQKAESSNSVLISIKPPSK